MRSLLNSRAVAIVAGGLMVALFLILLAQVLLRSIGRPLIWAEEFSTFAFIWLVFSGAALAYQRGEHLEVNLVQEWAKPKLGARLVAIWDAVIISIQIVFLGVLAIGLGLMAHQSWALYAGSLPGFRFGWIYLGALVAVVAAIAMLVAQLLTRSTGQSGAEPMP